MAGEAVVEEASTADVENPRERVDYWADLVDSFQGVRLSYEFSSSSDFYGRIRRHRTDNYQIVGRESDPIVYTRGAKHVRADPDDDYRLVVPLTGRFNVRYDDGAGSLAPGMSSLVTINRPMAFSASSGSHGLIMTIPRREIQHRLNRADPPAGPMDLTTGLGRVAKDMMTGLYAEASVLTAAQFDAVAERVVDLLCMQILGDAPYTASHLGEVESTIRHYIRRHVENPDLTSAIIARGLGWSVRQVQLALQHAGTTPRELIREERLQIAHSRLRSPAYRGMSVTDIALGLGFGSVSSFSTAFRQRFGTTPSSVRGG
ncbi:AraC family transcriptional regulator [Nocardia cyriacigeorgica]|uniref:AraC family transcriptional regulator n=1 Tax=Nocardia cyriacigeorgica TaxID=135487 RepID=UPI0013B96DD8|nr:AraC family transcriptional regulator [Nocardia cyriacigeorgica]NEW40942.1 AraC family transcriptional regulator [Nocardia cyriacigeorgica]NEW51252.1 AraC family transcriptional regulator [Nocardia cyriacigeorgica]